MRMKKQALALVLLLSTTVLAGCNTDRMQSQYDPLNNLGGMQRETEARRATEAALAVSSGHTAEALARYADMYENKKTDPGIAVNYAQLLRKTGDPAAAAKVLEPFMTGYSGRSAWQATSPLVQTEYAAALVALGEYERAEDLLNEVLDKESASDFHNDAKDLLGVALDAQGQHKEAEAMFRAALEGWRGDPSPVLNNLGLCLASRGRFDESLTTLRQALVMAPDKEEIARNIEVVNALRDRIVRKPPTAKKS